MDAGFFKSKTPLQIEMIFHYSKLHNMYNEYEAKRHIMINFILVYDVLNKCISICFR